MCFSFDLNKKDPAEQKIDTGVDKKNSRVKRTIKDIEQNASAQKKALSGKIFIRACPFWNNSWYELTRSQYH